MSMISEQVNKIRKVAKCVYLATDKEVSGDISSTLNQAADTIEALSANLAVVNMERSDKYYSGGWILCSERMPEENKEVICCFKSGVVKALVLFNCKFYGKVYAYEKSDILAWQPLPEPYHYKDNNN